MNNSNILEVKDLKVKFPVHGGVFLGKVAEVKAVDGVSFTMKQGETLGIVGESGCGKSTLGKAIINILKFSSPDVEITGEVLLNTGSEMIDLTKLSRNDIRKYRGLVQMIFQDPYSSLNARLTVGQIIEEPMLYHTNMPKNERLERISMLLQKVGLQPEQSKRYPHEFSGGQRQRIGIARALATNPKLIIADEPVSALDVSIQAQVINLMQELQKEFDLSIMFIAHDLSVVEHISSRIAVMYLGNIVEVGSGREVYHNPKHPYSKALLSAVPLPNPKFRHKERVILKGDVPTPLRKPSGCGFRTRCPIAQPVCADAVPPLEEKAPGHTAACPFVS
ncbi:MAG TPA: ATP-binding cassette domain-containing protein [Ignavibacteria bacterium]|nr:peptide ABC transporter ATP-binding protein [Bacteroidota bacterium]HRE12235.1 ATP-binding cassette domain-containing protein [Ignavibacteria bacterium]HRF65011.1 ATP-binding cassette domain-containing protein [Ignavibacteria bacterium]HRJ03438.1 ATP-binding cassette domain-containing protein [Ignavibacteria bacterium]HRJ85317.1 ATP-binding cassette domain-containing protein [Ignavibacteria bacterium]